MYYSRDIFCHLGWIVVKNIVGLFAAVFVAVFVVVENVDVFVFLRGAEPELTRRRAEAGLS